jgi:hypothetical protein
MQRSGILSDGILNLKKNNVNMFPSNYRRAKGRRFYFPPTLTLALREWNFSHPQIVPLSTIAVLPFSPVAFVSIPL